MSDIVIKKEDNGTFTVIVGREYADHLTFEEMIGMIATLCVNGRCLQWLKTPEQHKRWDDFLKHKK